MNNQTTTMLMLAALGTLIAIALAALFPNPPKTSVAITADSPECRPTLEAAVRQSCSVIKDGTPLCKLTEY